MRPSRSEAAVDNPSLPTRAQRVAKAWLAALLLGASVPALACPLCLGAGQPTVAEQLVVARQAVLALPTAEDGRFRVVELIKGERPVPDIVDGGYPRAAAPVAHAAAPARARLLLVRDAMLPTWTVLGAIGVEHAGWLRKLGAGKPAELMSAEDWRARAALVAPKLQNPDPLAAELAYRALSAVPYPALRSLQSRLDAKAVRAWVRDPQLATRQPLYLLLLGLAGDAQDAAALEQRLATAWATHDATHLGSLLAADLELRGPTRMAWLEDRYLRDDARSAAEIDAALLALSVHGHADATIPRERVIQAYRVFMKAHPSIAGYVARDLAAWQYWDAAPEYAALMKAKDRQQYPSMLAILEYLRRSPDPLAREQGLQSRAAPDLRRLP